MKSLFQLLAHQWFIIALIACIGIGWSFHTPLYILANQRWLRFVVVGLVMFAMALTMPRSQLMESLRRPLPWIVAVLLNIGLMPIVAFVFSGAIDDELARGFLVAATVPCTMASATVWTRRGGGDEAIPIMVTLITNASCFMFAPAWLQFLLGSRVDISFASLAIDLIATVLIPILLAQALLQSKTVQYIASTYHVPFTHFCQLGILTMVALGGVQIGERWSGGSNFAQNSLMILLVFAIALVFHLLMVAVGWWVSQWCRWDRKTQIGVSISGGQKTLMVGLQLAMDCGVSILPMVSYHLTQLIVDSYLVQWWNRKASESQQVSGSPSKVQPIPALDIESEDLTI